MALLAVFLFILAGVAPDTAAQQQDGSITLAGCPTSCGTVSVPYPFGFTPNCYRPGFRLTCTTFHNTTTLFIGSSVEVLEILFYDNQVNVRVPFTDTAADGVSWNATWTAALAGTPYTISSNSNNFTAYGCGVVATLLNPDTGEEVATCASFCGPNGMNDSSCVIGFGCCSAIVPPGLRSYGIRLDNQHPGSLNSRVLAAVMANGDTVNGLFNRSGGVEVVLDWAIVDASSCKTAKSNMSTYACRDYSQCVDITDGRIGYTCDCISVLNDGNPYVTNSCPEVVTLTSPGKGCPKKCGRLDVPFPFGIERGCYRHENFSLDCKTENHSLVLVYRSDYQVMQIMIEDGKMQLLEVIRRDASAADGSIYLNDVLMETSWVAGFGSCEEARNQSAYACVSANSKCLVNRVSDFPIQLGYNCRCKKGYNGNPYIHGGCQDIDECQDPSKYTCHGNCTNLLGSYSCACKSGMLGDPQIGCYSGKIKPVVLGSVIGISIGLGILLLLLLGAIFYMKWKKINRKKIKEENFRKNQGLFLQQVISSNEVAAERTKIFSLEELEKATHKFDETRILGRGGHGTVYKGILSDQRVVAIKRSKKMVQTEIQQFINEAVILSMINHRNVVKLFGCCLEAEVPLLVYEFVINGSLSDHLHLEEHKSSLSWDDRIRIAAEAAGALSYLHSSASISIFHRDVKTSNILLDHNFSAKISDFGASRSISIDQSRVLTLIQGTFGYLDPEYYHTGQFTEKSDVYSFGVILVELLTGEMPSSLTKSQDESNLCMNFLLSLRENRLFDIVEPRVIEGALKEELDAVASLAEACLNLRGADRPTMKEVAVILEALVTAKKPKKHPSVPQNQREIESLLGEPSDADRELSNSSSLISQNESTASLEKPMEPSLTLPR